MNIALENIGKNNMETVIGNNSLFLGNRNTRDGINNAKPTILYHILLI